LNEDSLTTDAQSALRRCIELFSLNTRFFIIVENKDKLLNPILSRFCEIYIPEHRTENKVLNLHQHVTQQAFHLGEWKQRFHEELDDHLQDVSCLCHKGFIDRVSTLYDAGYSCLDLVEWFKRSGVLDPKETSAVVLCFYKIKSEFRCEKLLMFYLLDYAFLRKNKDLENIGFM
jgi:hypothetical protein